ncbi:MAG: hypothetical protein ACRENM_08180, partial [Candidatus Dormibacteraceae bacterium]
TNGQRDSLYEQIRNHLASFGDLWIALETNRDYAAAERLAVEFGEDFHLLEDLGWNPEDGRLTVELTMEAHDLMEVIRRLGDEAQGGLDGGGEERKAAAGFDQTVENFEAARAACDDILEVLTDLHGGKIRVSRA